MNEVRQGRGSLAFSNIRYSDPDVVSIKYGSHSTLRNGFSGTLALVMDRTVANYVEQMGPFVTSTWLHALLVTGGPQAAARLGCIYIVSRIAYPICFYVGHPWLQISTVPGYMVIWYQLYLVVCALAAARPGS